MAKGKLTGYFFGAAAAISYGMNPLFTLPLYHDGLDADSVLFFRKDLDGKAGKWKVLTLLNLQDFKQKFQFDLSGDKV